MKLKDIEKMLQNEIDTFVKNDYKTKALMELKSMKDEHPNLDFIVNTYPDFNHIRVNLEIKGNLVMTFCFNPDVLKEDRKSFKSASKMIYTLYKMQREEEKNEEI